MGLEVFQGASKYRRLYCDGDPIKTSKSFSLVRISDILSYGKQSHLRRKFIVLLIPIN